MSQQKHITELALLLALIAAGLALAFIDDIRTPVVITAIAVSYYVSNMVYAAARGQLSTARVLESGIAAGLFVYVTLYLV